MEKTSEQLHLNISEFQCSNVTPDQRVSLLEEDIISASEVVTENAEALFVDKTVVTQKKIVLKEKVIIPKENLNSVCQLPILHALNGTRNISQLPEAEAECEEMEVASQESILSKMDISSQESEASIMETGSQEVNEKYGSSQAAVTSAKDTRDLPGGDREENVLPVENGVLGKMPKVAEDLSTGKQKEMPDRSLLSREKVLSIREAAVLAREQDVAEREAAIRRAGNGRLLNERNYPNPKRPKCSFP